MGLVKDLLFDALYYPFYNVVDYPFYNKDNHLPIKYNNKANFFEDEKLRYIIDPETSNLKIDLPYLNVDKLTVYIEDNYLIIKYENKEDVRRNKLNYKIYIGKGDVNVSYENGFLIIEKVEKQSDRKLVSVLCK
jgi:HSP20 family molecular chaperone IbpA